MKTHFYIFFLLFALSGAGIVNAQKFETKNMEYIYELLKEKCDIPREAGLFHCSESDFPLKVKYNQKKEITHLGFALFDEGFVDYFGEIISRFHERLFLELCLLSDMEINNYCKEHKLILSVVELTGNELLAKKDIEQAVSLIKENDTKYILVKDSLYCFSTWQNGDKKVELIFPSTFSLISGMDKKEADDLFEKELKNLLSIEYVPDALFVEKQDLHDTERGVFVKYGKTIFIKEMTSNLYFTYKERDGYTIVHDRRYPVESISNMIIRPNLNSRKLAISITHNAYGGEIKEYNTSLFEFLSFLSRDYNSYIGIEKITKEELNFTVIFQNKYYNCHHLLYIETSPAAIFNPNGRLLGTLYTYIPNHNIKDLYKEYIGNLKQIL